MAKFEDPFEPKVPTANTAVVICIELGIPAHEHSANVDNSAAYTSECHNVDVSTSYADIMPVLPGKCPSESRMAISSAAHGMLDVETCKCSDLPGVAHTVLPDGPGCRVKHLSRSVDAL